jgi:Flp pilus assembly secretin CpaC
MQITRFITRCLLGSAVLLLALSGCNRGEEKAPVKMTVSQALGMNILKTLNAAPGMKGHTISVGTTSDTVILNGKVKNAAQKKMAETIARQKAKTAKVINKIEVSTK